jgi:hypothetical protein
MPKLEVPVTERANPYTPSSRNRQEHDASPQQMAGEDKDFVHTFRLLDTDDEKAPSLSEDNTFGESPSVASRSCKSNNPFRMGMEKLEEQEVRYGSPNGLSDNHLDGSDIDIAADYAYFLRIGTHVRRLRGC